MLSLSYVTVYSLDKVLVMVMQWCYPLLHSINSLRVRNIHMREETGTSQTEEDFSSPYTIQTLKNLPITIKNICPVTFSLIYQPISIYIYIYTFTFYMFLYQSTVYSMPRHMSFKLQVLPAPGWLASLKLLRAAIVLSIVYNR